MVKQTSPRTFTGLAKSGHKRSAVNSGIFSNGTAGQKRDGLPKCSPSDGSKRNKADVGALASAVNVPAKKTSMPKTGKTAAEIAAYANHGEK